MEPLKMSDQTSGLINPENKMIFRMSGLSAMIVVISYIIITALYVLGGVPPGGGEEWLRHLSRHAIEWWAILGFSVLTDFLFLPVVYSLWLTLKDIRRGVVLAGIACMVLFVFLDLAVTWTNYSSLLILSKNWAAATSDSHRATFVANANYASAVLSSGLLAVYVILVPSLGLLMFGYAMLKGGIFSKTTSWLGMVSGILGIVSVVGSLFLSALGMLVIITSILTAVWFYFVGQRLLKISRGREESRTLKPD